MGLGGMFYGRNGFKKDRSGIAYHIEMDITGGACDIEAGAWDSETVSAVPRPCYEDCVDYGRCFSRQTVKEVAGMWMLKFYKAYVKNKRLKRMLAYWGRMK